MKIPKPVSDFYTANEEAIIRCALASIAGYCLLWGGAHMLSDYYCPNDSVAIEETTGWFGQTTRDTVCQYADGSTTRPYRSYSYGG